MRLHTNDFWGLTKKRLQVSHFLIWVLNWSKGRWVTWPSCRNVFICSRNGWKKCLFFVENNTICLLFWGVERRKIPKTFIWTHVCFLGFFSVIGRFLREKKVRTKSWTSRVTSTIVSVWAPAASAGTRAKSCADPWAPPPCSRSVGRTQRHRGSSAPWKRSRGRGWSPATNALRRWSCACSRASPSSSPACCSTSSWSEGI